MSRWVQGQAAFLLSKTTKFEKTALKKEDDCYNFVDSSSFLDSFYAQPFQFHASPILWFLLQILLFYILISLLLRRVNDGLIYDSLIFLLLH